MRGKQTDECAGVRSGRAQGNILAGTPTNGSHAGPASGSGVVEGRDRAPGTTAALTHHHDARLARKGQLQWCLGAGGHTM